MQPRERAAASRSYAVTAVLCVLLTAFSSPSLIGAASSVTMTAQHLEIHSVTKYVHARGDSNACAQRCQHERWQSTTSALRRPGLAFLAAFFAWGAFCAAKIGTRAGRLRSQALWGLVAALAGSLFCAQLCIQARPPPPYIYRV